MNNSKFDPFSISQFSKADLDANFQGAQYTPTKGSSTNCDLHVTDDHIADGGRIITLNATAGDNVDVKVIDIDNVLGYGANTVLKQFVTAWPIFPGDNIWDFSVNYPAKIYSGLYIRIVYHSVGGEGDPTPSLLMGYRLHKCKW